MRGSGAHQPFAEQSALGETGERIEIRQEADFVFLVQVLQRERQIRDQLAQHARFLVAHRAHVVRGQHQRADRRAIDDQWIGDDAAESGIEQRRARASGISGCAGRCRSAAPRCATRDRSRSSRPRDSAMLNVSCCAGWLSTLPDQAAGRALRVPGSISATIALA